MDNAIVQYLRQNKDSYAKDALIMQLRAAGHSEQDIFDATQVVYGDIIDKNGSREIISEYAGTDVKYAGFWIRFLAAMIDTIILAGVGMVGGFVIGLTAATTSHDTIIVEQFMSVIGALMSWIYYIFMTHRFRATFGKKVVGIEVRSVQGYGNASLNSIILRETIGKIISVLTLYIGYFMAGFTQKKQALHDKIAGTVVVYKKV